MAFFSFFRHKNLNFSIFVWGKNNPSLGAGAIFFTVLQFPVVSRKPIKLQHKKKAGARERERERERERKTKNKIVTKNFFVLFFVSRWRRSANK